MDITTLKIIPLLDVLYDLQELECKTFGMETPPKGHSFKLPNGETGIKQRLWEILRERHWGNQDFGNDRLYIIPVEELAELPGDMLVLITRCVDAINEPTDSLPACLVFYISW